MARGPAILAPALRLFRAARTRVFRLLLWLRGRLAGPRFHLPMAPWPLATPTDGGPQTIVTYPEGQEPARAIAIYGAVRPADSYFVRVPPEPPALRLRRYSEVVLLPRNFLLSGETGRVLPQTFDLRSVKGRTAMRVERGGPFDHMSRGVLAAPIAVDEPVFVADTIFGGFGHFLLEVLPKMGMLRDAPENVLVATSQPVFQDFFDALGVPARRVLHVKGPAFLRTAYIPDPPVTLSGRFHPLAREVYARLAAIGGQSQLEAQPRIYLSRQKESRRPMLREAELEAMLVRYGFAIVHPQELSAADQIQLVSHAEMIVGLGGSAMHNLVFARPSSKALFIVSRDWHAAIDQVVARADGQFGFVFGEPAAGQHPRTASWTVDFGVIEAALKSHFGIVPMG